MPKAPPPIPLPAARPLDETLAQELLRSVAAGMAPALKLTADDLRRQAAQRRPALAIEYDRVLTAGAFGTAGYDTPVPEGGRTLSQPESMQYGFDLTILALFTLLSEARCSRAALAETYRRMGSEMVRVVASKAGQSGCPARSDSIKEVVRGARDLLDALKAGGYIGSYSVDDSDVDEALWRQRSSLSTTRLTVTLSESATLRAALLLNGRGVTPELARPLLSSYLSSCGASVTEESDFFLDSYRENPLEYRASEMLLSFTIVPSEATA